MNQYSIQNTQVIQFKAQAKNFYESGFQPKGYIVVDYDGSMELSVFHGNDLPSSLAHGRAVALPLSTDARPANVVRFLQQADVRLLLTILQAGHKLRWNGIYNVGIFSDAAQDAVEGLRGLLKTFNIKAELDAIAA